MISFRQQGDFSKLTGFLERCKNIVKQGDLNRYGEEGVAALASATPKYTGLLASSWYYTIERTKGGVSIVWSNSDIENGANVAVILQYGHAAENGIFVEGIDYINPALKPVFERIANDAWGEVTK